MPIDSKAGNEQASVGKMQMKGVTMATSHGSPPRYTEFLEENKLVYTYLDAGAHSDPRGGWEGPNQRQATKLYVRRARRLGQNDTAYTQACMPVGIIR